MLEHARASCPRGHAFDRARSGYWNLLQPQDRAAKHPGDAREVVHARRRTVERGILAPLRDAVLERLRALAVTGPFLDVGAGEGFVAAAVARDLGLPTVGVDLSAFASELSAKSYPELTWVVANGDRKLPFCDHGAACVSSITGPKHAPELRRVLAENGHALLVVNGDEDQRELRSAVLGSAPPTGRAARAIELCAGSLELVSQHSAKWRVRLEGEALVDLAATTYRGARHSQRERLEALESLDVTFDYVLLVLRPLAP